MFKEKPSESLEIVLFLIGAAILIVSLPFLYLEIVFRSVCMIIIFSISATVGLISFFAGMYSLISEKYDDCSKLFRISKSIAASLCLIGTVNLFVSVYLVLHMLLSDTVYSECFIPITISLTNLPLGLLVLWSQNKNIK